MVEEVLGLFISPVTTAKKRAEEKNIKKEAIIALILAVIIGLGTILSTYISITKAIKEEYKSLKSYNKQHWTELTEEEFKEEKKEAKKSKLENAELVKTFFKTTGYSILAIIVISGMMFVISLLLKSQLDFISALAITNSAFLIYIVGFIINFIFSFIYAPIGNIVLMLTTIYGLLTLTNTFKDSITVTDTNRLVQFSAAVIGVVFIILYIIIMNYINSYNAVLKAIDF